MRARRAVFALAVLVAAVGTLAALQFQPAAQSRLPSTVEILHELRAFRTMGTVLHVGAHPDDENTQLIAYLARGRAYRTAYLSVTRGDGGQNLLGAQLGDKLGVARTQELLAARRIDGGEQFFTRAIDYGFSKDVREALSVWGKDAVLGDVVRVIRKFRPDVIVTRFSPVAGGTHGHHTASAVLAAEAFRLAGDPRAYPEQLRDLAPWQPKRIFMNAGAGGGRRGGGAPSAGDAAVPTGTPPATTARVISIDISGTDPVLGESFAVVASRSRGMHKTQGFGLNDAAGARGGGARGAGARGGGAAGPRLESLTLIDGEPATTDIMDGVDTTWNRIPGGGEIGRLTSQVIAAFDTTDPSKSVAQLLEIRTRVGSLPTDATIEFKKAQLDKIIVACLGLSVESITNSAEISPDDRFPIRLNVSLRSNYPVSWVGMRYADDFAPRGTQTWLPRPLSRGNTETWESIQDPLRNSRLTQPYWLREDGSPGLFNVPDPRLIGSPENAPEFPVGYEFQVGAHRITVWDEPVETPSGAAVKRRGLDVVAPVSLSFDSEAGIFAPGSTRTVPVTVTATSAGVVGTVRLDAPQGWQVTPPTQRFTLGDANAQVRVNFTVKAPQRSERARIGAIARVNNAEYNNQRVEINYEHIPVQLLQPAARLKASSFDLAIRGRRVGYIAGAGDLTVQSMMQMGYSVDSLTATDMTPARLREFDAIVVGIRAYNVNEIFPAANAALFAYAENGGTVVVQYHPTANMRTNTVAPFPVTLSDDRVTNENATVSFLAPDHPVLNTPNKITAADFQGWVQELGLYFPNQWDSRFTPILAANDEGEAPVRGALIVARHGQGWYVYTGLSFFRQLPAGVPGAYRLFANLLSLGN